MLTFAAHVPTSPLLMPSISGERVGAVDKTTGALTALAEDLYAHRPDALVLISDHPTMFREAFSLSVADPYVCSLEDVGDLGYQKQYHPDFRLIDALQRDLRAGDQPLTLTTDNRLHFAATVPLHFLAEHVPGVRLVPLSPSGLDAKAHFTFGQALKQVCMASEKRVAVISAGDLSQRLTKFAPGGLHKDGKKYDTAIQTLIREKNTAGLLQLSDTVITNAQESSYRKLLMLFGVLDGLDVQPDILSYEYPFGVGYLVAQFHLA